MWMSTHMSQIAAFTSGVPSSSASRKRAATDASASRGHGVYQSIVQQLMSEGNWRQRTRSAAPTGDIVRMMWRLSRTRDTKRR